MSLGRPLSLFFLGFCLFIYPAFSSESSDEKRPTAKIDLSPGKPILPPSVFMKDSEAFKKRNERLERAKLGHLELNDYLPFKLTTLADLNLQLERKLKELNEDYKLAQRHKLADPTGLRIQVAAIGDSLKARHKLAEQALKAKDNK